MTRRSKGSFSPAECDADRVGDFSVTVKRWFWDVLGTAVRVGVLAPTESFRRLTNNTRSALKLILPFALLVVLLHPRHMDLPPRQSWLETFLTNLRKRFPKNELPHVDPEEFRRAQAYPRGDFWSTMAAAPDKHGWVIGTPGHGGQYLGDSLSSFQPCFEQRPLPLIDFGITGSGKTNFASVGTVLHRGPVLMVTSKLSETAQAALLRARFGRVHVLQPWWACSRLGREGRLDTAQRSARFG